MHRIKTLLVVADTENVVSPCGVIIYINLKKLLLIIILKKKFIN